MILWKYKKTPLTTRPGTEKGYYVYIEDKGGVYLETIDENPGRLHPPMFSWNVGMVMHILRSDPVLRELEYMQVDGLGTAYVFFYDKQGHWSLGQDTAHAIRAHVEEAFSEWISCSAHFTISLFPLMEVWW